MRRRVLAFDPIAEADRQWRAHGWEGAARGMSVVTSIMRVHQLLQARVDATLHPFGLTFARFELLRLLAFSRAGALPLGKIGDRLQVHPASVTNAVDRLERAGLVRRRPQEDDRRGVLAEITRAGREVVEAATAELNTMVFADTGLSPHDQEELFRILRKVRHAAGDF